MRICFVDGDTETVRRHPDIDGRLRDDVRLVLARCLHGAADDCKPRDGQRRALERELHCPVLLRIFSMIADVDQPCSIWTRTTLPPRASTVSRPTMASAAQSAPLTSTSGWMRVMMSRRRLVVEDRDGVDAGERREDLGALGLRRDGPGRALVRAHGSIGVDADDERVARARARLQVANVAGMQQIEDAVREDDRLACPARGRRQTTRPRRSSRMASPSLNVIGAGEIPSGAAAGRCRRPSGATSRGTCRAAGGSRTARRRACARRRRACRCPRPDRARRSRSVTSASPSSDSATRCSSMSVLVP